MKKACLPVLIGLMALAGCAHQYVMTLNNGAEITTTTKPQLQEDSWYYTDAKGEEHFVPKGSVREIAPASVAAREHKPQGVKGEPPKKRHWYFLWLA